MQNTNLEDKINAMGSGTIMGAMSNFNETAKATAEELQNEEVKEAAKEYNSEVVNAAIDKAGMYALLNQRVRQRPIVKDSKTGRNDPCPCGSGKKYKNCCLSSGKYETYSRA